VVGDVLFSGLAGAMLAVAGTVVYTEVRDSRRRVEERAALARLLLYEVSRNKDALETRQRQVAFEGRGVRLLAKSSHDPPGIGAWLASRIRLAQLVKPEDFTVILDYYHNVQRLVRLTEMHPYGTQAENQSIPLPEAASSWDAHTEHVEKRLKWYAEPRARQKWLGF
jgi:hypothetical protein